MAGHGDAGRASVVVGDVDRLLAVDEMLQMIAAGDDRVVVPVFLFDGLLQLGRVADGTGGLRLVVAADRGLLAALSQNAAAALLVENARIGVAGLEIALVTTDDVIAQVGAAVLDAGVSADNAVREPQLEIVDLTLTPDNERVSLGRIFGGRAAGNGAVLDRPELCVAVPAIELLSVEDRLEAVLVGGRVSRQRREQQQNQR